MRYSYPIVLHWKGDRFCYADQVRVSDVEIADNRSEANDRIEKKVETIITWEHRKAYDGICPVIPDSEN